MDGSKGAGLLAAISGLLHGGASQAPALRRDDFRTRIGAFLQGRKALDPLGVGHVYIPKRTRSGAFQTSDRTQYRTLPHGQIVRAIPKIRGKSAHRQWKRVRQLAFTHPAKARAIVQSLQPHRAA